MNKNITIYTPATIPLKSGAGVNAFNLAKEFVEQGYETRIVTFKYGNLPRSETIEGVRIIRVSTVRNNIVGKILSYSTIVLTFLYYLLRSDLAIIFGPLQGFLMLIISGRLIGKKVVFRSTMLGTDDAKSLNNKGGKCFYPVIRFLASKMGGYIAQSPAMAEQFIGEFGSSIPMIETAQGVNTKKFKAVSKTVKATLRKKLNICDDEKTIVIISVGYVIERKGLREVFDSLSALKCRKLLYVVLGDYQLEPEHYLYSASNEMKSLHQYGLDKLGKKILFTGSVENTHEYLCAGDIFILNSLKEGMPNVLLEAMATGLPSIVSDLKGVNNYVTFNRENCLVVSDTNTLKNCIEELIADNDLRALLGDNASRFIREQFSIKRVATQIVTKFLQ